MKDDYLVIDKKVLSEIFQKVIDTKKIIENGDVKGITEATKVTGISRSVFYKYKEYVFEFSADGQRLAVPVKGLNIVKYSDGSARKVVVK